nr:MAG TPA: hypothetical protein [Caudoviricetes sp.]
MRRHQYTTTVLRRLIQAGNGLTESQSIGNL